MGRRSADEENANGGARFSVWEPAGRGRKQMFGARFSVWGARWSRRKV